MYYRRECNAFMKYIFLIQTVSIISTGRKRFYTVSKLPRGVLMKIALYFLLFASVVCGQLTSEQAKAFQEYYYNGSGRDVVLADMQICDSVEQNECSGAAGKELVKGRTYMVWMSFVVPRDDQNQNIIIQFNYNGMTMKTATATVSGSIRYRTWKGFVPNKSGTWEIVVIHDKGEQTSTIRKMNVTVIE